MSGDRLLKNSAGLVKVSTLNYRECVAWDIRKSTLCFKVEVHMLVEIQVCGLLRKVRRNVLMGSGSFSIYFMLSPMSRTLTEDTLDIC